MIHMTIRKYWTHSQLNHIKVCEIRKIYQFYQPKSELLQWRVSGFLHVPISIYRCLTIVIRMPTTRAFGHVLTEMEQQYLMQQELNIVFL